MTTLADDIVRELAHLDRVIRLTTEVIADPKTMAYAKDSRMAELSNLLELRKELICHDQEAKMNREILIARAERAVSLQEALLHVR